MKAIVLVFLGGGFGSVLRYLLSKALNSDLSGIPYGTFAVNLFGSLLIGIILGLSVKGSVLTQNQTLLLATGFCGGFSTFSTFSFETFELIKQGNYLVAILNMVLSVVVGVLFSFEFMKFVI